jgi:hypothetical protein
MLVPDIAVWPLRRPQPASSQLRLFRERRRQTNRLAMKHPDSPNVAPNRTWCRILAPYNGNERIQQELLRWSWVSSLGVRRYPTRSLNSLLDPFSTRAADNKHGVQRSFD